MIPHLIFYFFIFYFYFLLFFLNKKKKMVFPSTPSPISILEIIGKPVRDGRRRSFRVGHGVGRL